MSFLHLTHLLMSIIYLRKKTRKLTHDEELVNKNYLKISPDCKNLLLGDSNMKNINRRKLDRTGQTEIRTYRGARIQTVTAIINKCQQQYPQVDKVTFCIGTNNCSGRNIDHAV